MENIEGVRINKSVREALTGLQFAILPASFAEDQEVRWIMQFGNFDEERPREDSRGDEGSVFYDILKHSIEKNIQFYYSALIYIGRRIQVSQSAIKNIDAATERSNLRQTAEINAHLFNKELEQEEIAAALLVVLNGAKENHQQHFRLANEFWGIWRTETKALFELVNAASEANHKVQRRAGYLRRDRDRNYELRNYFKPFYDAVYRLESFVDLGQLKSIFLGEGIKIRVADAQQPNLLISLLSALPLTDPFGLEDILRLYVRAKESELEAIREENLRPVMMKLQDDLLKLFSESNPLDRYRVLQSAADEDLVKLYKGCKLPNGTVFYEAGRWLNSLSEQPYSTSDLPFKDTLVPSEIDHYAGVADSVIKRVIIGSSREPMLTFNELLQRIFEKEWTENLVLAATRGVREQKSDPNWTFESTSALISLVIERLNATGYRLKEIASPRLQKLWDEGMAGNYPRNW